MSVPQITFRNTGQARGLWGAVRAFFDTLPVPIFEISSAPESEITYCNGVFAALLALAPGDLIGCSLAEYGARPEDQNRLRRDLGAAIGTRNLRRPYRIRLKGRTGRELTARFDWLERKSEVGEDHGCLIIAQEMDPPPRDQTSSVRRVFYEVVERSGEAIGITAQDGTYLYRNRSHKKLFGRADTPLGRLRMFDFVNEDIQEMLRDEVLPASDEKGEWVGLVNFNTPDKSFPVWVRFHSIEDPVSGNPIRFAFSHDYSDELARRTELAEAKLLAETAKKAQQDLFFAISHDFRAILQAASLYLDAADRKIKKHAMDVEELGRARDAIYSVQDQFQSILDLLSKDTSTIEPKIRYVRGQEILDYIKHTYGPLAEAKGLTLSVGTCNDAFPTDANLMKRISGNLVSNAIKFTQQGEVRVECVVAVGEGVLRISDTGVGIPEEFHKKIFDQFFRIDPETGEGLGVGLSIIKHLCDLLGHQIELDSTPGQGSTFTVTIDPVAEPRHESPLG